MTHARASSTATRGDRPRWRAAALASSAAAVALGVIAAANPGTAEARIVPGVSVAGVELGDTQAQVKAALGKPEAGSTVLNYRYIRSRGFGIYFIAGRVFEISVVRRPQATPRGIRVGSTLAALRAAHRGVACRKAVVGRGVVECSLRGRHAGRSTETLFVTRGGRVTSIAVHFA